MVKPAMRKWVSVFMLCFGHFVFTQPQHKTSNDSLLSRFQQIEVKWPKTVWFGKYKISLGDYGNAIYKEGGTTTDQNNKKGVSYTRTKTKFSVNLITKDSVKVELKGKVQEDEAYVISSGGITGFVIEGATGIQTESLESVLKKDKTVAADIILDHPSNETWSFKRYVGSIAGDTKFENNFLSHDYQFIEITFTNTSETQDTAFNSKDAFSAPRYEFFMDGILIGATVITGFHVIWLKPDLDDKIKGILTVVALSL
jgi:hypothetical protein